MARGNLPDPKNFISERVPNDGDFVIIDVLGKGCNAIVFRAFSEKLQQTVAYKVIPFSNLVRRDDWSLEAQKANGLAHPSVVKCTGFYEWEEKECVVLKCEYIKGVSLREYIKSHKDSISIQFVVTLLREALSLFNEMKFKQVRHGDFHSGNILVKEPEEYEIDGKEVIKVTDFGVGKSTATSVLDDYEQLAHVVTEVLQCVDYQALAPKDKYIFNVINDYFVSKHLIERDTTIDPLARNPRDLVIRLQQIDLDYNQELTKNEDAHLITPFDYLSCEQIGQKHSVLHALYSDKFLGISQIESANNLVLTGPRGCGKSTVFRSLSLKQKLMGSEEATESFSYIGVYYHCNDLYYKFPRYCIPEKEDAIDLPLHYLTARLVAEILDTAIQLSITQGLSINNEESVASALWKMLGIDRPELPQSDSFSTICSRLNKECHWVLEKQRFASKGDQPIKPLYGPDKLLEICSYLRANLSIFNGKVFYVFIDDYSIPHISKDLQKSLNRLLMQRAPDCFFKMATESPVSFEASDLDEKHYAEGREFELLNLGLIYMCEEGSSKLEFIDDVFQRRLNAVENYPIKSLQALVGNSATSNSEIGRKIALNEKYHWYGRKTLGAMCSGDVHQVISLVKKMVSNAGGQEKLESKEDEPAIVASVQHNTIREHAGHFLHNIQGTGSNGKHLVQVVTAFGNVAASYLKYKKSKNEQSSPPYQASRIEMHDIPNLNEFEGAQDIYNELLRYSVFIQDPRGKSLRGQVVPRLILRRFLVPHYNLTFSLRDSIKMKGEEFVTLLLDPEKFERDRKLTEARSKEEDVREEAKQMNLLDGMG